MRLRIFLLVGTLFAQAPVTPKLTMDRSAYSVGMTPQYKITGVPGSTVFWSSAIYDKNTGVFIPTAEQLANYGHVIGSDGTITVNGGEFTCDQAGGISGAGLVWEKTITVIAPDRTLSTSEPFVFFLNQPATACIAVPWWFVAK